MQKPQVERAQGALSSKWLEQWLRELVQKWDRGGQQERIRQGHSGTSSGLTLRIVHGVTHSKVSFKRPLCYWNNRNSCDAGTTHYAATRAGHCSECGPTLSHALLSDASSRNWLSYLTDENKAA